MKLFASGIAFFTLLGFIACSSSDPIVAPRDAAVPDVTPVDDSAKIPCAPRAVLQTVCQQCHASTPKNGAPFPLVTRTDILTMRPGGLARDLMIAQLVAKRMPLAPVTIEDEQRATLLAWLQDGALPATDEQSSCTDAGSDAAVDAPEDATDAADAADAADADDADTGAD